MKTKAQLEQEYQEFLVKIGKAGKDFSDAINGLSLENFQRFKNESKPVLIAGLEKLIKMLTE